MAGVAQMFRVAYLEMPPVTRAYTTACILTTLSVQLDLLSPFQLYFNPLLIYKSYQFWRLFTPFFFFGGSISFMFLFNLAFMYRYSRMLEENSFHGRTADFVMLFLFGSTCMVLVGYFINVLFFAQALNLMVLYVWARRNPSVRMNVLGLLTFQAPYLPWVILGFTLLFGHPITVDLLGMAVGHIYYFLEDVYPNQPGGSKLLKTPMILKMLCDPMPEDPTYEPMPEERPGGFDWGNAGAGDQPEPQEEDQRRDEGAHPHQD